MIHQEVQGKSDDPLLVGVFGVFEAVPPRVCSSSVTTTPSASARSTNKLGFEYPSPRPLAMKNGSMSVFMNSIATLVVVTEVPGAASVLQAMVITATTTDRKVPIGAFDLMTSS